MHLLENTNVKVGLEIYTTQNFSHLMRRFILRKFSFVKKLSEHQFIVSWSVLDSVGPAFNK